MLKISWPLVVSGSYSQQKSFPLFHLHFQIVQMPAAEFSQLYQFSHPLGEQSCYSAKFQTKYQKYCWTSHPHAYQLEASGVLLRALSRYVSAVSSVRNVDKCESNKLIIFFLCYQLILHFIQ